MNKTFTTCLALALSAVVVSAKPRPLFNHDQHPVSSNHFGKTGSKNLPQLTKTFSWNHPNSIWNLTDTTVSTYSPSGDLKEEVTNGSRKITHSLTSDKTVYQELTLVKNISTSAWDSSFLNIIHYDVHGNDSLNEEFNYNKASSKWVISYGQKSLYIYNTYQQMVTVTSYTYDTGSYVPEQKIDFVYNGQGNVFQAQINKWDTATKAFVSDLKITDIVWHKWVSNPNNSLEASYRTLMYMGGGVYLDQSRTKLYYNNQDEETQTVNERFDGSNWSLDSKDSMLYTYNQDTALTVWIRMEYDLGLNEYLNIEKQEYSNFWGATTGIQQAGPTHKIQTSIYPNPGAGTFVVDVPLNLFLTFELFDVTGRQVHSQELNHESNEVKLDTPDGMYFYLLKSKEEVVSSGKLAVE